MDWKDKTQYIFNTFISKVDTIDRFVLKKTIDAFCPFNKNDYFAMKIWKEEKKKFLENIYKKNTIKKIKDFYDKENEF